MVPTNAYVVGIDVLTPTTNDEDDDAIEDDDEDDDLPVEVGADEWIWEEIELMPPRNIALRTRSTANSSFPSFLERRSTGPMNIPDGIDRPMQCFDLFLDQELRQQIVTATNDYAQTPDKEGFADDWQPLTDQELNKFIGLLLFFGICRKPSLHHHWKKSEKFGSNFAINAMSRNRFDDLLSNLHYINSGNLTATERQQRINEDGFWLVRGLLTKLAVNFGTYWRPGQKLDIDEMTIPFKGRHKFKCYNPSKPNKWHLKFYCLNDSSCGYLVDFFPYEGKSEKRPAGITATSYPAYKLINQAERFHNRGYVLAHDNWFCSAECALMLKRQGVESVGTIKLNRKHLPDEGKFPKTGRAVRSRGTSKQMKATVQGYDFYFTAWMDNKPVHMFSTFPGHQDVVFRNGKSANGTFERLKLQRPTIIGCYNEGMGGTDLIDQMDSYYAFTHRTQSWHIRFMTHMFMVCTVNAYIVYKSIKNVPKLTLLLFIDMLTDEMVVLQPSEASCDDQQDLSASESQDMQHRKRQRCGVLARDSSRLVETHHPSSKRGERGKCRQGCGKRTGMFCVECNVYLCCEGTYLDNCFYKFHHV